MTKKTQKELAFLYDLYIAPDWGERFAELVDEHVEMPKEGRALYIEAGTGGHAMSLHARAGKKLDLICVDQNEAALAVAREKAIANKEATRFQREDARALTFTDDQFDVVLVNSSFTPPPELKSVLSEIVRVAKPGGTVAWWLPTASSFGEFFSIYWEALLNAGVTDHGSDVENLITELPTVAETERWLEAAGLEAIHSWTAIEEFDYESGEEFFNSPLITDFLLPGWIQPVPKDARARVLRELACIIDEERHSGEFALTLKATLALGQKKVVRNA